MYPGSMRPPGHDVVTVAFEMVTAFLGAPSAPPVTPALATSWTFSGLWRRSYRTACRRAEAGCPCRPGRTGCRRCAPDRCWPWPPCPPGRSPNHRRPPCQVPSGSRRGWCSRGRPMPSPFGSPHCSTKMPLVVSRWHLVSSKKPLSARNLKELTVCGVFAASIARAIVPRLVLSVKVYFAFLLTFIAGSGGAAAARRRCRGRRCGGVLTGRAVALERTRAVGDGADHDHHGNSRGDHRIAAASLPPGRRSGVAAAA